MMSFDGLRAKYHLNRKHFFKYLQLRNYVKTNQNNVLSKPCYTELEKNCNKELSKKGCNIRALHLVVNIFK